MLLPNSLVQKNCAFADKYLEVSRRGPDNKYLPTTWTIKFNLDSVIRGTYNLRLAIASATRSDLEVKVTMIRSLRILHILHS